MGERSKGPLWSSGYVTVVFSMIFLTVISVVLTALEAVRVSAVRLQAEVACAVACEAFLSQYQPQVQAGYGLYLVERDGLDTEFLKYFIRKNCFEENGTSGTGWFSPVLESAAIDGQTGVSDEDFRYLEDQICDLMTALKGTELAGNIWDSITGTPLEEVETKKDQLTAQLEQEGALAQQQEMAQEEAAGETSQEETQRPSGETVEDPRKNLTQLLKYPVLSLLMEDDLSDAVLDMKSLSALAAPEENVSAPAGFMEYTDVTRELKAESLDLKGMSQDLGRSWIADAYILEFFNNGANPQKTGRAGALSYEVEYILSGRASDSANLQNTVNRILLIRMILNMTFLLQSASKTAAAHTVAAALAAAVLMPFLEEIIYLLILAAWAYGEALVDCRSLLGGGRVPLMKTEATWSLSLELLTKLDVSQLSERDGAESSDGMSYEDYLRILLMGVSREKKYTRMLNLIEANTRLTDGDFLMSQCVFGISVRADFVFYPVFFHSAGMGRYEHHVHMSIAY